MSSESPIPKDVSDGEDEVDGFKWTSMATSTPSPSRSRHNSSDVYKNNTNPKGISLIISNENFYKSDTRVGTEVDCRSLKKMFKGFNYEVVIKKDLTADGMRQAVLELVDSYKTRTLDSLFLCVLTHGESGGLIGSDDNTIEVDDILAILNNENAPQLAGKPKIVILQACRGENRDGGVIPNPNSKADDCERSDSQKSTETDGFFSCLRKNGSNPSTALVGDEAANKLPTVFDQHASIMEDVTRLPKNSDLLVAFPTLDTFVSYRNRSKGSWFIEAICEVFEQDAKFEHIVDMLTTVNRKVADEKQTSSNEKQMPNHQSTLRKKFFFFPPK